MTTFFRYVSYLEYIPERRAVKSVELGGIAFHVVRVTDEVRLPTWEVKFVICPSTVRFSSTTAKRLLEKQTKKYRVTAERPAVWVLISKLLELQDQGLEPLRIEVEKIRATHRAAWEAEKQDWDIINAMKIEKMYTEKTK